MTCAVVLWVLLGTSAGYVSSRLYKSKEIFQCLFFILFASGSHCEENEVTFEVLVF